ncbi:MAG: hypothetical protein GKC05_02240 [Methanomicrobiales archaeon]|nr:hypothetical protein [Methanomicrobiales archaeon]NYT20728.1 hypothetical protein [Methanomicrobiales archaeon]
MTASRIACMLIVLILVFLTILAGCIKPPDGSSSGSSGGSSWFSGGNKETSGSGGGNTGTAGGAGTSQTPSPTPTSYLTPATPFPVETPPPTTSSYTRLPDPTPEVPDYVAIFYDTLAFKQNKTAYSYQLERPPMVIEMCIKPNMTTRTIWYESRVGEREEKTETITSISPAAWFEVTVRDQPSGTIVAREGFARSYSVETAKKLTLRSPGTYLIEFGGNDLSAEIQIRVPETGSQTGKPLSNMSCGTLLI